MKEEQLPFGFGKLGLDLGYRLLCLVFYSRSNVDFGIVRVEDLDKFQSKAGRSPSDQEDLRSMLA